MGIKTALSIVVLMAATTACSNGDVKPQAGLGSPRPSITATATPTPTPTSTALPPPDTATPVARTVRVIIDPFKKGTLGPKETGLKSGWSIVNAPESQVVDCTYDDGSPYAVGVSTHYCGVTADSANACWTERYSTAHLLCLDGTNPYSRTLRSISSENVNDFTKAAKDPQPLFLELQDGSLWWARTGGAWIGRDDGYDPIYGCANKVGACAARGPNGKQLAVLMKTRNHGNGTPVDKSGPTWHVLVGWIGNNPAARYPAPVRMSVTRAWFMAGHLWPAD